MSDTLNCPKCTAPMRTYERNGVHVDQCTECRGIFLDRGELERMVDAESRHYDEAVPAPSGSRPEKPRDDDRGGYQKKPKSKMSFLGEFFE